jgi:hypothetical protein
MQRLRDVAAADDRRITGDTCRRGELANLVSGQPHLPSNHRRIYAGTESLADAAHHAGGTASGRAADARQRREFAGRANENPAAVPLKTPSRAERHPAHGRPSTCEDPLEIRHNLGHRVGHISDVFLVQSGHAHPTRTQDIDPMPVAKAVYLLGSETGIGEHAALPDIAR